MFLTCVFVHAYACQCSVGSSPLLGFTFQDLAPLLSSRPQDTSLETHLLLTLYEYVSQAMLTSSPKLSVAHSNEHFLLTHFACGPLSSAAPVALPRTVHCGAQVV